MLVKVIILSGEGINCERESATAFQLPNTQVDIIRIQELLKNPQMIYEYHILMIPGGFSYADEIHSGHILALQLQTIWKKYIESFLEKKGLILGVCNGFQVLVKLGVFDLNPCERKLSLIRNKNNGFLNKWVKCTVTCSKSIWLQGVDELYLPIRHGEGNLFLSGDQQDQVSYYQKLKENDQIALVYHEDINGSYQQIAGLCDSSGQILGLMPHPEAALDESLYPDGVIKKAELTKKIFSNAVNFALTQQNKNFIKYQGVHHESNYSIGPS